MTFRVKPSFLLPLFAAAFLLLAFSSCDIAGENGRTYMTIHYDTSWSKYERLEISWLDPATGAGGELFDGSPSALKEANRFPADGYEGQKITILFKGYLASGLAYEEHRGFDGAHPDEVTKVIVPLGPGGTGRVKPPRLSAILAESTATIHDSIAFQANATLDSGTLKAYEWDYDGNGQADQSGPLAGASGLVKGFHRFAIAGVYTVTLKAFSSSDSASEVKAKVTVLQDEPTADAGRDQTVFSGEMVTLAGVGKDGRGQVAKFEWKIGSADYIVSETGTFRFKAPDLPGDVTVVFRVEDDDSQTVADVAVVHVVSRNESNLTGIGVSAGKLTPQFDPGLLAYTDTVGYESESIVLTPTGNGELTVNDAETASGAPSAPIALKVGNNPIKLTVKLAQNPAKTYWLNVVRMPVSSDGDLSSLVVTGGTLDSAFSPQDTLYAVSVPNGAASTSIKAALRSAASTLTIDGFQVDSDAPSSSIPLKVGINTVLITVTTRNGATKTYTLLIHRAESGNANLSGLGLSGGTLAPAFEPGILEYDLSVGTDAGQTSVSASVQDAGSKLAINGIPAVSGLAIALDLVIGANNIAIEVTAENGRKAVYTVRVTRAGNKNADLSGLTTSAGRMVPAFAPETVFYSLDVSNGTEATTVTATVAKASSILSINGRPVESGKASPVELAAGPNPVTITVESQTGDKKSYTIVITRAPSADSDLKSLGLSAGALNPGFSVANTAYTAEVGNEDAWITVTPTVSDTLATVAVNGTEAASGKPSAQIPLSVGANPIAIVVTAQNGGTRTYTLTVTRAANGDATLSALTAAAGPIAPSPFTPANPAYGLIVAYDVASTTVTPVTTAATSSVTVAGVAVPSGAASAPLPLALGTNSIALVVTAQNGNKKTYTLTIDRVADANADLSSLAVSAGPLTPAFAAATTAYVLSVGNATISTTVTPAVSKGTSTVTVNGSPVASGSASAGISLATGPNAIPIVVTSQGGGVKTYTVTITRAANADASLSGLSASAGDLSPPFSSAILAYAMTVPNAVVSTTVTPTAAAATTTITVNGTGVASGSASGAVALAAGGNAISVVATAENGDKRTYTLTVIRSSNGNADLSALTASAGALTPAFTAATTAYAFTVANSVTATTITPTVAAGGSTVKVNGTAVVSGNASGSIPLSVGTNAIAVEVRAQDNTVKTYTVTVTRSANGNAELSALAVSASPAIALVFSPGTLDYTQSVANGFGSTTVTPTAAIGTSTLKVNGVTVASGAPSAAIPLNVGLNTLTIVVTAQDLVSRTYTVKLTRAANANANLGALGLSAGTLNPAFSASEIAYASVVPMTTASMKVTPTAAAPTSIIKVNGNTVVSGQASASIPLSIGVNPIAILVTAESGVQKTYTLNVRRQGQPIARVSGGYGHTLILKTDGTLWATGSNDNGQLGDGSTTLRTTPVLVMSGVAGMAAGKAHSLIVKADGTLWGTGSNAWGRLGLGATTETHVPMQIMTGVADVATQEFESLILKTDGAVWGMGRNASGELGDGTTDYRLSPVAVATGATRVAVGGQKCFVFKGTELYQSLGTGGFGMTASGVIDIAGGIGHSLLLKTDGTVWSWGNNHYGQSGAGAAEFVDDATQIMSGVSAIAAGDYHSLFLKANGELWGVGFNEGWGLGDGTQVNRREPIPMASGVASMSAGGFHNHYITPDGSLWGCGHNSWGVLGADHEGEFTGLPVFVLP